MTDKGGKHYTIEDIARELGVSKTTVSRALSGKGRIGKDTAERVHMLASQRGYRPNAIARGLAQSRTRNLGLIIPSEYADSDASFFRECIDGVCEEASKHDYDVVISLMKDGGLEQIHRLVERNKVDGIILTRTVVHSGAVRFLKESRVPFVVIGPSADPDVVSVDNPNREASREMTGFLLMKGFDRLALIGGNRGHYVTESRRDGFADAHRDKGTAVRSALMFMGVEDYREAMWAVEQILKAGADAIVCMDESICSLVLGCLREKRVEVPNVLRLASLYDSRLMERSFPPVTSVHFDTKGLGRNACLKMLGMLGESVDEERFSLNYQVILRESTK